MMLKREAKGMAEYQVSDIEMGSHKGLDRSPFIIRGEFPCHYLLACSNTAYVYHDLEIALLSISLLL